MAGSRDRKLEAVGYRQRAYGGLTRVNVSPPLPDNRTGTAPADHELRVLLHRLNNQLGIILAHAELLEVKVPDDANRARAAQIVASALDAMGTSREIVQRTEPSGR